jgi:hypothetical protein
MLDLALGVNAAWNPLVEKNNTVMVMMAWVVVHQSRSTKT